MTRRAEYMMREEMGQSPHGAVVVHECWYCERRFATYEGRRPKGWTKDENGRTVCELCRKREARRKR